MRWRWRGPCPNYPRPQWGGLAADEEFETAAGESGEEIEGESGGVEGCGGDEETKEVVAKLGGVGPGVEGCFAACVDADSVDDEPRALDEWGWDDELAIRDQTGVEV